MGGFAGFLGSAAGGYAQAAREDTQRQFETEQNRRGQLVDMLGKLAQDPTAHPETQQAALQMAMETLHAPWNKPIKPDINKLLTAGPAQPTQTATSQGQTAAVPHDLTNLIPKGQPMPTPPTSAGMPAPPVAQQAQFTPPPNMGMRYTPAEQAGMAGQEHEAVAAGQMSGQIGARQKALEGMNLPDDQRAMLALGTPGYAGMQTRGVQAVRYVDPANPGQVQWGTYDKVHKVTYAQGGDVVPNAQVFEPSLVGSEHTAATTDPLTGLTTKSSSTTTKTLGGQKVGAGKPLPQPPGASGAMPVPPKSTGAAPSKPAGVAATDNTVGGRALPAAAVGIIAAQARNFERSGIAPTGKTAPMVQEYMAEHGMVPHTAQQVSDYQKGFDLAMSEDKRFKMMDDLQKKVMADPSPENVGSYDAALLAYHMGMTVGQVKGMRSGKDMVMLHEKARSLPESLRTAAEGWVNGAQLSPEQRQNFVDLAKESRKANWNMAVSQARGMGFTRFPQPTPGLPALGVVPGTLDRKALDAVARDHKITYGEARKQAAAAGYSIDD